MLPTSMYSPRCVVATQKGRQFLFLKMPAPPPTPVVELEPLMIFGDPPPTLSSSQASSSPTLSTSSPASPMTDAPLYAAGSAWSHGCVIAPLCVSGRGKFQRSMDLCQSEFQSFQEVRNRCGWFDSFVEYPTVFGAVQLDRVYLLVAKSVEVAAQLPLAGQIMRVLDTAWIPFDIPGTAPVKMSAQDQNKIKDLLKYSYGRGHYYSDDVDLRLPFPFTAAAGREADDEEVWARYDWSSHLRRLFDADSLRRALSVLMRGYAGERVMELRQGGTLHVLLLGRQNNINPGPRYLSRGLNAKHGAGNDLVYDYVMWKSPTSSRSSKSDSSLNSCVGGAEGVAYARHTLLRGTIPVHWKTDIRVSLSEPVMMFSTEQADVIRGSDVYFVEVMRHLQRTMQMDSQGRSREAPQLRCISLLRLSAQSSELVLARHYREAVAHAERAVRASYPSSALDLVHMDWLNTVSENDLDSATASFWQNSINFLAQPPHRPTGMLSTGVIAQDRRMCRGHTQTRFVRINCADSLDRTNLASFFTLLQVSMAMLRALAIPLTAFPMAAPLPALDSPSESDADKDLFTAFAAKETAKTANPPPFLSNWTEARDPAKLSPYLTRLLGELFVDNGDSIARLYTGSAAMHSNTLRNMCGMRLSGHNAIIATQRRFENVFEDGAKLRHTEVLLGRHISLHFPSLSRIFLTQPVPYTRWACTLLMVGTPPGTVAREVEEALRLTWDGHILPWLKHHGHAVAPPSSALCMTVTMPPEEEEEADGMTGCVGGKGSGTEESVMTPDGGGGGGGERGRGERLVVVEMDPHLCSVVDAPMYFRREGYVPIRGCNCVVASYSYPVQVAQDSGTAVSSAVKTVSTSLKSGIKKLVRNLN